MTKNHHLIFFMGIKTNIVIKWCTKWLSLHAKMILLSVVFFLTDFVYEETVFTAAWWDGPKGPSGWTNPREAHRSAPPPSIGPHIWCIWMKLNRVNVRCPPYCFHPSRVPSLPLQNKLIAHLIRCVHEKENVVLFGTCPFKRYSFCCHLSPCCSCNSRLFFFHLVFLTYYFAIY